MNPINYEQVEISNAIIGQQIRFLEPDMQVSVEFVEDQPVSVLFPDIIEVRIVETTRRCTGSRTIPENCPSGERHHHHGAAIHQERRPDPVDVASLKYMDRARGGQR